MCHYDAPPLERLLFTVSTGNRTGKNFGQNGTKASATKALHLSSGSARGSAKNVVGGV